MNYKKLVKSVFCFIFFFIVPSFSLYADMTMFVAQGSQVYAYDVVTEKYLGKFDLAKFAYFEKNSVFLSGNMFDASRVYMSVRKKRRGCVYRWKIFEVEYNVSSKSFDYRKSCDLEQRRGAGTRNLYERYRNKDFVFLSRGNHVFAYSFEQKKEIKFNTQGKVCAVWEAPGSDKVQVIRRNSKVIICDEYELRDEGYKRTDNSRELFDFSKKEWKEDDISCHTSMFDPSLLIVWYECGDEIFLYNLQHGKECDLTYESKLTFNINPDEICTICYIGYVEYDPLKQEIMALIIRQYSDRDPYESVLWKCNMKTKNQKIFRLGQSFKLKNLKVAFSGRFVPDDNDEEERVEFLKNYTENDLVRDFTVGLNLGKGNKFRAFRSFLI